MAKFRRKSRVIEPEQFFPGKGPRGLCYCDVGGGQNSPHVHTTHAGQTVKLEAGDWIIPEPNGDGFYPCKPDIFADSYEPVD